MKRLNISSHYILMLKVTKVILKAELKPLTKKDKEFIDNTFNEWSRMVRIVNSYVKHVYPLNLVDNNGSIDYDPSLRRRTYEFIDNVTEGYKIKPQYTLLKQRGLADIAYDNAKTALEKRSLPDLEGLKNSILIRMSKRPLTENRKDSNNSKSYTREATILYNNTTEPSFLLRIGRERSKKGNTRFIIASKALNDKNRFNMLINAIEGNDLTIGDPCMIVKKGDRYFLHIAVSKNVDIKALEESLTKKDKIRIVGVDLGISRLATAFCIEVDKQEQAYKLVNATSIEGKQFINALTRYVEEKSNKQSDKTKGKSQKKKISRFKHKKESYIIANRKGESKRIDLRRQIIGYICNKIIKFAKENNADIIVIEDLKGLSKRLRTLKSIRKALGILYNNVNREGLKALNRANNKSGEAKNSSNSNSNSNSKKKKEKILDEILRDIKTKANSKDRALRLILKHKRRIERQQLLLSFFAYNQFSKELENEALWSNIIVERVKPTYTSQKCVRCGLTSKVNRLTQRRFKCNKCNWEMNADYNASLNIALRYAERKFKIELYGNNNGNNNNLIVNNSKQGKGSSTMTITSAVTPLHASINAGSSAGCVTTPCSGVQGNSTACNEGRSSFEGQTEYAVDAKRLCTLDEFIHEEKGDGG